jgi:HK97 family phage prohead protease
MMPNKREIRMLEFEVRAEQNASSGKKSLVGRPIVYGQIIQYGWRREVIGSGALDDKTDLKDVRFLIGHNTSMVPLARSRNNNVNSTMQLQIVPEGMDIRVDLDTENNQDARTLYSAVERGDITGMSFMFTVDKSTWEEENSDNPLRRIVHIDKVFEVSAVAFPAYDETSLQTASKDSAPEGVESPLESALKQELQEFRDAKHNDERRKKALEILRR